MLFNSIQFPVFLVIVFSLYWMIQKVWGAFYRNIFIILISYLFYGWWDWRFLGLLLLSSLTDFTIGLLMDRSTSDKTRKRLLYVSLLFNLGLLMFFKYFNFFADSFSTLASSLGFHPDVITLKVILPVGISFYTFQSLSYTIVVYWKKLKATHNLVDFMAFVSFFPQLVAGPIERASRLLPQFQEDKKFNFDFAVSGCKLMLWGFFKKIVIADTLSEMVNTIFPNYLHLPGSDLLLGAIYFAFQIYGDFSGYSDIAIGTARLFGFDLMKNFNYPYFSRDISEFWRKWHISLSSWFRDYVYIPLGGSKVSNSLLIRNVFIVFIVSGFWHGANWTFICWGLAHWLFYLPLLLLKRTRINIDGVALGRLLPSIKEFFQMCFTFLLATLAWIFFRSANVSQAFHYLREIFSKSLFHKPVYFHYDLILLILIFIGLEWFNREKEHPFQLAGKPRLVRWSVYSLAICVILFNFAFHKPAEFIYFQF
jgi:alginate O-acetyltransferase complex protein AlgI